MTTFISKTRNPELIMRPLKVDRDGNIQQEAKHIRFEDRIYKTEDKKEIEFIRGLKNFKADYLELAEGEALPTDAGYQGNTVGITQMNNAPTPEVDEINKRVDKIESSVEEMKSMLKLALKKNKEEDLK